MTKLGRYILIVALMANALALVHLGNKIGQVGFNLARDGGAISRMQDTITRLESGITVPVKLDIQRPEFTLPELAPIYIRVIPVVERPNIEMPTIAPVRIPIELDLSAALQQGETLVGLIERFRDRIQPPAS